MTKRKGIDPAFKKAAPRAAAPSSFATYLENKFDDKATAKNILGVLERLGLPAPEKHSEFMAGTEGALMFLNKYGVVVRIEKGQHTGDDNDFGFYNEKDFEFDRVNDSPWVLQPIATLQAGNAVIEICPGTHAETDDSMVSVVRRNLRADGIDFWDTGTRNMGRLPVNTDVFPKGISVVVDRPAVRQLTESVDPVRAALRRVMGVDRRMEKKRKAAETAEEALYAPLRDAFDAEWTGGKTGMKAFWALCESYVADGKLVAGWNDKSRDPWNVKGSIAQRTASGYDAKMNP